MDFNGFLLAIIATIGFSIPVLIVATSTKRIGSVATLFLWQAMGIPIFALLVPIMPPIPAVTHIPIIMTIGVCFTFVYLIFLQATKVGTLAVVSTISELFMVVTTILGVVLLHESFTIWKAMGLLIIFAGVVLLGFQMPKKNSSSIRLLAGVPYALVSAIGTGIYLYAVGISARTDGWFLTVLFIRIAIAMTSCIVLLYRKYDFSLLSKKTPWMLLAFAAAVDVGAFSLYNYTISHYEVSTITIITAAQSAIVALLSWKFLKEKLNPQQILGLFVVVAGLVSLQIH